MRPDLSGLHIFDFFLFTFNFLKGLHQSTDTNSGETTGG